MNIIFDLGAVVFDWQPLPLLEKLYADEQERALVQQHLLSHPDWIELDRGTLSWPEAIDRSATRSGLAPETCAKLLHALPDALVPFDGTIEMISRLSQAYPLYVLSNMHTETKDALLARHQIWHHFKGIVFSCDVKQVKPEAEIYLELLERHSLAASECLFIDDMAENVSQAVKLGLQAIQFKNPEQCRAELIKAGIKLD